MDTAQDVDSSGADATGLVDIDWAGHWRRLVDARNAQQALAADFWDRLAPNFAIRRQPDDPVLSVLEPHLQPRRTLIDAGAGTGRSQSRWPSGSSG